jgi:hypothetical protein
MRSLRAAGTAGAVLAALLCALAGRPARAHIVYSGPTLHQLVAGAELIARARIVGHDDLLLAPLALSRPVVDAELIEVWKGGLAPGRVRFAQHGHGVATFEPGDEVVVFLRPAQRSPELAALAASGALDWVSLQEHDDQWVLSAGSREPIARAVQGYVALEGVAEPGPRVAALHRLTLELLVSPEDRLAWSALQDVVRAGDAPLIAREDVPALWPRLADARVPVGLRAGLLAELARRGYVTGDAPWLALIDTARPADLPAALRAAGPHAGPEVRARLVRELELGSGASAEAAALALGMQGNAEAVAPLARALGGGDVRLRRTAIRALGRIGGPAARAALERAAREHPDADTRRRAAAELRVAAAAAGS